MLRGLSKRSISVLSISPKRYRTATLHLADRQTIPALLKSAVQRQNTIIVVPSYFDFVRLNNYLRKEDKMSYTAISEYVDVEGRIKR